jgi:hypothetical protein
MSIVLRCSCGQNLQIPESAAGARVRCKNCQAVLTVPSPAIDPVELRAESPGRWAPSARRAEGESEDRARPARPDPTGRRSGRNAGGPRRL